MFLRCQCTRSYQLTYLKSNRTTSDQKSCAKIRKRTGFVKWQAVRLVYQKLWTNRIRFTLITAGHAPTTLKPYRNICNYRLKSHEYTKELHTYIPFTLDPRKGSRGLRYFSETPTFYQNDLALRTTGVTGVSFAVWLQSISGGDAVNPLVAFYAIHGRKREVLFFRSVPDTTRDETIAIDLIPIIDNFRWRVELNGLVVSALGMRSRQRSSRKNLLCASKGRGSICNR
jgi:hypothetical protein